MPWRRTREPYAILVAEVMLQQTQVDRVLPKYHEFLARFPDFEALAEAAPAEVIRVWSGMGYNRRALALREIAKRVVSDFGGKLPSDTESLRSLKGIGEYTASALACFAFEQQVAVVDTNVRRVLGRILRGEPAVELKEGRELALAALPEGHAYSWNQALMDLGATLCVERQPRCLMCPVREHCRAVAAPEAWEQRRVAERAESKYEAIPFKESNRYYRGRLISLLRGLANGEGLTLRKAGPVIREGFGADQMPWLEDLVRGLERDGLLRVAWAAEPGESEIGLPGK